MTAPTQTSPGQIAWEVDTEGYGYLWSEVEPQYKADWERIGAAVAAAHQKRVAAWLLEQPDMGTTDSQAALWQAAQMLMHGEIV